MCLHRLCMPQQGPRGPEHSFSRDFPQFRVTARGPPGHDSPACPERHPIGPSPPRTGSLRRPPLRKTTAAALRNVGSGRTLLQGRTALRWCPGTSCEHYPDPPEQFPRQHVLPTVNARAPSCKSPPPPLAAPGPASQRTGRSPARIPPASPAQNQRPPL